MWPSCAFVLLAALPALFAALPPRPPNHDWTFRGCSARDGVQDAHSALTATLGGGGGGGGGSSKPVAACTIKGLKLRAGGHAVVREWRWGGDGGGGAGGGGCDDDGCFSVELLVRHAVPMPHHDVPILRFIEAGGGRRGGDGLALRSAGGSRAAVLTWARPHDGAQLAAAARAAGAFDPDPREWVHLVATVNNGTARVRDGGTCEGGTGRWWW
jgi:hypothetical protein